MTISTGTRVGPYEVVEPDRHGRGLAGTLYDIGHENGRDYLVAFLAKMNTLFAGLDQTIEN